MTRYEVELTDEQAREWLVVAEKGNDSLYSEVVQAIADAIRANPPKPPRMDEPGMWGVVVAHLRGGDDVEHVRTRYGWVNTDNGEVYAWESLLHPVLVRDGIDS